ncbi:MAG: FAD-dependent oxidoreductase [Methanocorpusculum sp.]|nr:FAD-dependent oxidoreductase [Methanocorpusculum sp.]
MIIVIGGGPAGRMAALRLAGAGKEVTILEKRSLGGQCVHDGCMLICGLNDVARSIRNAAFLQERGVVAGGLTVCYPEIMRRMEEVQAKLAHILEKETIAAGVKIEYGTEAEVRDGKVFVNGEPREAEQIIIAAGAQMNIPDVPGADLKGTYTARSIKQMPSLPKRLAIIGGGIAAAEFAYIYSAFGSEVFIIARSELLSVLPAPLQKDARRDLADVHILEHAKLERIEGAGHVAAVVVSGETIPCDAVLFAAGMKPESPFVSGVAKRPDGAIIVDEHMETSVKGIYACGDVIGAPYFTPVARLRGFAAADAILGRPRKIDLAQVPFAVVLGLDYTVCPAVGSGKTFGSPNIAGPESFWHVADGSVGHMYLSVKDDDGKILGFATSGPATGVVGTYLGYLVRKGVTVHEFSPMLEVHPVADGLYSLIRFQEK